MTVDEKTWSTVFRRDNGYCRYCGLDLLQAFSTYTSAGVDHIIGQAQGGSDELDNLVLACPGCNSLMSRMGHLQSFESRLDYIQQVHKERHYQLQNLRDELRNEG